MKTCLLLLSVVCLVQATKWTGEAVEKALEGVPLEKYVDYLPEDLRREITKRAPGDDPHWCCKVDNSDPRPMHLTRTDIMYEKVSLKVKIGYEGCSLWGMGRCSHYTTRYHGEVRYVTRYVISPQFINCPDAHIVCCNGYHKISGNCVHEDHVIAHGEVFEALEKFGFISGQTTKAP